MNDEKYPQPSTGIPEERRGVVLPCSPEEFKDFISSLLGKPQTLRKNFSGTFDISFKDIECIHQLILQRIYQQNEASLIQFTARIVFSDDSSILLNSIDDFLHYNEVRPIVSISVHLSWSFLVRFQNKSIPEKQEIEVSFSTNNFTNTGRIDFQIHHTARTWGADIEALLSGHIKTLFHSVSKFKSFVLRRRGKISLAVGAIFFLSTLIMCYWTGAHLLNVQTQDISRYLGSAEHLPDKIDVVLKIVSSGLWAHYYFSVVIFLVISLIFSLILGAWVDKAARSNEPSFIILTRQSEAYKKILLKTNKRKRLNFIASVVTGILTGVIANIVFKYFWN